MPLTVHATQLSGLPNPSQRAVSVSKATLEGTYDRHAEKLREKLTLARIDRHSGQLEELVVKGIRAFAERVLPRAADL